MTTLRITGPGALYDLITPWAKTLQVLTVGTTEIDFESLSPDFPVFSQHDSLDISQTPSDSLALLTLFAPAPITALDLNFRSSSLPPSTDRLTFAASGPLFRFISTAFPDADVIISDDFARSDELGSILDEACEELGWTRERRKERRGRGDADVRNGPARFEKRCEDVKEELKWASAKLEVCRRMKDEQGIAELEGWIPALRKRVAWERD